MRAAIVVRGLDGLAQRIAARHLPAAADAAATEAAQQLAADIAAETGAPATVAGLPGRRMVRIADAALMARARGSFDAPGDAVLDRLRLAFSRMLPPRRRRP